MGFGGPYRVTDYSAVSRAGFRDFLRTRFGTLEALNRAVDGFASWDAIDPPSKDIRSEPLRHFHEHIDLYAQGVLPVSGCLALTAHRAAAPRCWCTAMENWLTRTCPPQPPGRRQAKPEFKDANTGWRGDLDFRHRQTGLHRLDFYLQEDMRPLVSLGPRQIAVIIGDRPRPWSSPCVAVCPMQ